MGKQNGYWKRHPNKEIQAFLIQLDQAGWRIKDPPKYYSALCPCGDHKMQIAITPSNSNYVRDRRARFKSYDCRGEDY